MRQAKSTKPERESERKPERPGTRPEISKAPRHPPPASARNPVSVAVKKSGAPPRKASIGSPMQESHVSGPSGSGAMGYRRMYRLSGYPPYFKSFIGLSCVSATGRGIDHACPIRLREQVLSRNHETRQEIWLPITMSPFSAKMTGQSRTKHEMTGSWDTPCPKSRCQQVSGCQTR